MRHDFSTIEGINSVMREIVKEGKKMNLNVYLDVDFHYGYFAVHIRQYNEDTQTWGDTVYGHPADWIKLSTENISDEIMKVAEWMKTYKEDRAGQLESRIEKLTEELNAAKKELKKIKKHGKDSNIAPGN